MWSVECGVRVWGCVWSEGVECGGDVECGVRVCGVWSEGVGVCVE